MVDELVTRLENATGPSRELDAAIEHTISGAPVWPVRGSEDRFAEQFHPDDWLMTVDRIHTPVPRYTSDPACTLPNEGGTWRIEGPITIGDTVYWIAKFGSRAGTAATEALARRAAALRSI